MKIGIDIGSRFAKIANFNKNGELIFSLYDSSDFYRQFGKSTDAGFSIDLQKLGFNSDVEIIATGYGRERVRLSGAKEIPEIQAHALGSVYMLGMKDFTLIDFGGQDTKVIRVESAKAVDFLTSDRCAASTGRFLENMARILKISIDELAQFSENPEPISSTCAVFAETEILEKIAQGIPLQNLAAGINQSVVKRFAMLIKRFPLDKVIASGGVAKSKAVIRLLSDELDVEVIVPNHPQYIGAIGCLMVRARHSSMFVH